MSVAIEHGTTGMWYGRFVRFLGTHARSDSRNGLLRELTDELDYHVRWLHLRGEEARLPRNRTPDVVEESGDIPELGESGGAVALFDFDRKAVGHALLQRALRYMQYNRADLMQLISGLDDEMMDSIPVGRRRSIRGVLSHVCNAEEFYVSRLGPEADGIYEGYLGMPVSECDGLPILQRLSVVRNACKMTLRILVLQRAASVFRRAQYTSHSEEEWTAHKVLRRFLEHEREHIYNIREYRGLPLRELDRPGSISGRV